MVSGFAILGAGPIDRTLLPYYIAIMALSVVVMMLMRRRARSSSGPSAEAMRKRFDELAAQRGVKEDMQQLLAELQDLSRKISAQIDTKFAKLETSIADADRRIEQLQRLLRTADGKPTVDIVIGGDADAQMPPAAASDAAVGAPSTERHAPVYELADAGKSPIEIAQALGRPTGEIELILALRSKS